MPAREPATKVAAAACVRLLFQALVEMDGDAAILHAGERPYIVAPTGAIELSEARLTAGCIESLIGQCLPLPAQQTFGMTGRAYVDHVVIDAMPLDRFSLTAIRSHGDLRLDLHRLRESDET